MQFKYLFPLCFCLLFFTCKSPSGQESKHGEHQGTEGTNHLAGQNSPYLLQHAFNPVDWYPWGEEALAKARAENKLLIISVGYSACHWCHVMEHESFEDSTVAKLMNDHFVSIKVDREERPDVDDVYMTACHLSNDSSCGWPLNAVALPDGRPVWAGTYFPKKDWMSVLNFFIKEKADQPEKLQQYATDLTQGIKDREQVNISVGDPDFSKNDIKAPLERFVSSVDRRKGGRKVNGGKGTKFPMPSNWLFLLQQYDLSKDKKILEATETTLEAMAMGGIYDQLGGGFARYSVDPDWHVPHFEKMLYDNGQLVSLYAQAYQATKNPIYKQVVEQTLEFTAREMTHSSGGFYSSYDADSEGEEGKFYVWKYDEAQALFSDDATSWNVISNYFDISRKGNWEHGNNVLRRLKSDRHWFDKFDMEEKELLQIVESGRQKMFTERKKRIHPGLDDKILTGWNALMLKGYVDAYRALGKEKYKIAALKNGNFIRQEMMDADGRLNRNFKDGKSVINAFLDDYALTAEAFISLYQITFDEAWLGDAQKLVDYAIVHFKDAKSGMFYFTSDLDDPLVVRKMDTSDNVIPGSNSTIANVLFLLGNYYYNDDYIRQAERMMNNVKGEVTSHPQPAYFTNWLQVLSRMATPPYEIAIVGPDAEELSSKMQKSFLPNAIFLGGKSEGTLELLSDKLQEGETYIYVCQNKACQRPVKTVGEAMELMR